MESSIHREVVHLYSKLLDSQALLKQIGRVDFVTQPKEIIYRENKLILYRYQAKVKNPAKTPLLLVFALINRPDILDFAPDNSFIQSLLEGGRDVYLLDWGYPTREDENLSLNNYINGYLKNCVERIKKQSGLSQLDLLGICQGGVLSLCYASLFPKDLRHLILISTPVNFQSKDDSLSELAQKIQIDSLVKKQGNVPGSWLAQLFTGLRPFQLQGKKYLTLLDQLSSDKPNQAWLKDFFLMEKWLLDTPDLAGLAFAQFVKIFYQQNSLIHGKFNLETSCVDLKMLSMPILNLAAKNDHIVPPAASRALKKYIQSPDYRFKTLPGGHIGVYVSRKTAKQLPRTILSWLKKRESKSK